MTESELELIAITFELKSSSIILNLPIGDVLFPFFRTKVRRLFEGGAYLRAAFIQINTVYYTGVIMKNIVNS
uniref:Uncharacterized protein n=1 Tax=Romanomermis culicivorax TaxID=13658 RepID=A0A915HFQ4_ROMCU